MNDLSENNDKMMFADETRSEPPRDLPPWKLLIVDDDITVHNITTMVLGNLKFHDRSLEMLHAYTGEEAIVMLQKEKDIAAILLDVVMETDNAGLVVVKKLRQELNNKETRIILRTGHPGYAPENKIIIEYDINDYKEKTELTSQKLVTSIISALRSYSDLIKIKELNLNLENEVAERTRELEESNKKLNSSLNKIREDLEAGKRIQLELLPPREKTFGDYTFTRHLIPSLYLSGDFVDYFSIDKNRVGFYFADVCGHGASSAFITVRLKSIMDNYIKNSEAKSKTLLGNPSKFLTQLNEKLIEENLNKHLTLFYGVINKTKKELKFAHGGQFPHPVIYNNHETVFIDNKGGMPLGLYGESSYEEYIVQLADEFVFVIFSDGILEVIPAGSLQEKQDYILSKITTTKLDYKDVMGLFDISNNMELHDDITFLIIRK